MSLTPEQFRRAEALFLDASQRSPAERAAFLEQACGDDPSVRDEVLAMLRHDGVPDAAFVLTASVGARPGTWADLDAGQNGAPGFTRIGPYKILALLGEGGMGAVYEAERERPRQIVALKIIRPGLATAQLLKRFELEQEILARLQHPGIARIYHADVVDIGAGPQPYFAMERIHGQPLTAYAQEHRLDVRQRLELLVKIVDAVQYAHAQGVIHRDLKPGNILVEEEEAGEKNKAGTWEDGNLGTEKQSTASTFPPSHVPTFPRPAQPKILDFGVARVADAELRSATLQTSVGEIIGTLPYMSPEQASGDPALVDIRSDIYSLGVIAYELLAGRRPYELPRSVLDALRVIREREPASLASTRTGSRWSFVARTTPAAALRIDADVETIIFKALEKDKERRYPTAAALATDLRRFLNHEPIAARPPSALYHFRKFARRHRGAVIAAACVAAALVLGLIGTTGGWLWALRERDRAAARERETKRVAEFQSDMLRTVNIDAMGQSIVHLMREQVAASLAREWVGEWPNRRPRTREEIDSGLAAFDATAKPAQPADIARRVLDEHVLRRAAETLERQFGDQPAVRAAIQEAVGRAYHAVGLYDAAEPLYREALALRRAALGPEHPDTLNSLHNLAILLHEKGDYAAAEPLYQETLAALRRLPDARPAAAQALNNLAQLLHDKGDYVGGEAAMREALAAQRQLLGEERVEVASSIYELGCLLDEKGDAASAETLCREALALQRKLLGAVHPDVATSLDRLASFAQKRGDYAAAEPLYREALAIRRKFLGTEHPATAASLDHLANLLRDKSDFPAAEILYREALALRRKMLGDAHPAVATNLQNLANLLQSKGDNAAAESLLREALAIQRKVSGNEHPAVAAGLNDLAVLLQDRGDYAAAEPLLREALAIQRKNWGDVHSDVAVSLHNLANLLHSQGDYAAAEPLYREALALKRKLWGNEHPSVTKSLNGLATLLRDQGDNAAAEPLLREALELQRKLLGEEHEEVAASLNNLALVLWAKGDPAAAEPQFRAALALLRKLWGNEHPDVATALNNLAGVLQDQKNSAAAEALFREALALRRKLFGEEHPDVANSLNNLAALLKEQGRLDEAEPLCRETLAIQRRRLGADHPEVAISLNNLAALLRSRNKLAEAEPLYREALVILEAKLPPGHGNIANARIGLGITLLKLGRFPEAEALLRNLWQILMENPDAPARLKERVLNALIQLYEAWQATDPDQGHDRQIAEWRKKLEQWQAATQPASP